VLDFLLVIFPTFCQPLGFALGVTDFVFLFAAAARHLSLRPVPPLALGCAAIRAAMLAGLNLGTYLLALESLRKTRN